MDRLRRRHAPRGVAMLADPAGQENVKIMAPERFPEVRRSGNSLAMAGTMAVAGTIEEAERELSYYRRLLHGRMDLLAFEMRRRRGEETRTLIEALPEILSSGIGGEGRDTGDLRHLSVELDLPAVTGRRDIDQILEGDALMRVTSMEESELADIQLALTEAERAVSEQRRRLHEVIDRLQAEIIDRYKRGLTGSDLSS